MSRMLILLLFQLGLVPLVAAANPIDKSPPEVTSAGHTHTRPGHELEAPAERWHAEAALSAGMGQLAELSEQLSALQSDAEPAQLDLIGVSIEKTVQRMFAECRLAPEPDAALHGLLAEVLDARHALQKDRGAISAKISLDSVLARYREWFIEPK